MIESRLEKRTKGVYIPVGGKILIAFMDDFNMPMKETYGSQPPLELIRQWIGYGFWYYFSRFIKSVMDVCPFSLWIYLWILVCVDFKQRSYIDQNWFVKFYFFKRQVQVKLQQFNLNVEYFILIYLSVQRLQGIEVDFFPNLDSG